MYVELEVMWQPPPCRTPVEFGQREIDQDIFSAHRYQSVERLRSNGHSDSLEQGVEARHRTVQPPGFRHLINTREAAASREERQNGIEMRAVTLDKHLWPLGIHGRCDTSLATGQK